MKYYHLTFIRDGINHTAFIQSSSIVSFLTIEKEFGYKTHIIYSRETTKEEYELAIANKVNLIK